MTRSHSGKMNNKQNFEFIDEIVLKRDPKIREIIIKNNEAENARLQINNSNKRHVIK